MATLSRCEGRSQPLPRRNASALLRVNTLPGRTFSINSPSAVSKSRSDVMKQAVYGIANTIGQANAIVDRLHTTGFPDEDISVLLPDKGDTRDFAHEKHTKAPEGATAGGVAGLGVGGALGLLAGL